MKLKDDVTLDGLRPVMLRVLAIADEVHLELFGTDVVVTEGTREGDGLHPKGLGIDLRSREHSRKMGQVYVGRVKARVTREIGPGLDMLRHGPPDHYHAEFDPKP